MFSAQEVYSQVSQSETEHVLPDCEERDMVIYALFRVVRDFYINSRDGGKLGAYRKQCRSIRKQASFAILSTSEETFSFRWLCRVVGFDPITFRNQVIFNVKGCTSLVRNETTSLPNKVLNEDQKAAQMWLWDEAPVKYQLSEKPGHFIMKVSKKAMNDWLVELENSPMDFQIEQFELTSGNFILIVKNK